MNRLRAYMIRFLLGKHKLSQALDEVRTTMNARIIEYVAEQISKDTKKYTDGYISTIVGKFSPDMLASAIESNEALSEQQKTQIAYILRTPRQAEGVFNGIY